MGDRNYYSNLYNSFPTQSYNHTQFRQSLSSLFDLVPPQDGGFSVNTSMPTYIRGSSYNRGQYSDTNYRSQASLHSQLEEKKSAYHPDYKGYDDDRPPPSYNESRSDRLLSRSGSRYDNDATLRAPKEQSPAWNYVHDVGERREEKSQFSHFFDIPGRTLPPQNSSEWSSDNYNSSQSLQHEDQRRLNPYGDFSRPPSTAFSSDYEVHLDRSSQKPVASRRQVNDFKQNQNRGFGRQNLFKVRGKRGFRGRGNWKNSGKQNQGISRDDKFEDKNSGNQSNCDSNQQALNPVSEDRVGVRNLEQGIKEEEGSEDDRNEEGRNGEEVDYSLYKKDDIFIPCQLLMTKYEYYPPDAKEMGEMFKDLVIYFFFKVPKNMKERNPFVVICESFRRSSRYSNIEVEDGYDVKCKQRRKFCTLRYHKMMMVRGIGENSNIKEARVRAGIELINKLAMSCYTLKAKPEYFNRNAFEEMKRKGDVPGVYRFAPLGEASDFDSACNYLQLAFSKEDSDEEYMFNLVPVENHKLKGWANKNGFNARVINDEWIGICRRRTTQYWRDKILASGSMETEKFILTPPQGIGNNLMCDFNIEEIIPALKNRPLPQVSVSGKPINVYGPPGVGPQISTAQPPWERRGGGMRNKKKQQNERRIMEMVQRGVPLTETRGYRFLSNKKKQQLKKKMGFNS